MLLLHSICGVATNILPMEPSKLHKLAKLLTPAELVQVTAFPSILRLMYAGGLLDSLKSALANGTLDSLSKVTFHRVMDNVPAELSGEEFWIQLNYQTIHLLDFLPAAYWQSQLGDPLFALFIDVHDFMMKAGKLDAKVDFKLSNPAEINQSDGMPMSLGRLVSKFAPQGFQRALAAKSIRRWSAHIGHSLDFKLIFS